MTEIAPHSPPGVISMTMGDHRKINRSPGVNVKIAQRTKDALAGKLKKTQYLI